MDSGISGWFSDAVGAAGCGTVSALSAGGLIVVCGAVFGSQTVVPVLLPFGTDAGDVRVGLDETPGGVIAGGICVVSTCDSLQVQCLDPCWRRGSEAGGGEEEVDLAHGGHLGCGEGTDRVLDD